MPRGPITPEEEALEGRCMRSSQPWRGARGVATGKFKGAHICRGGGGGNGLALRKLHRTLCRDHFNRDHPIRKRLSEPG